MRIHKKIASFLTLIIMSPLVVNAADAAAATADKPEASSFNAMLIVLVSLSLILLLAIFILGNTLLQLSLAYRDKLREKRSGVTSKLMLLLLGATLASHSVMAEDAAPAPVQKFISGLPSDKFYALIGIVGLELLVIIALVLVIRTMVRIMSGKAEVEAVRALAPKVSFWDRFNKVVPIEKEKDIMLDHDYDGIRELDNSLPPWWKYGFYLTIVVAVVYLWYYHGGGNGPSSYDEYVAEVQKGEEVKAAYLAKTANNVDENTVQMADAAGIAAGQTIFQSTCSPCHAKDGGGGVGPNLTDEYWLHGGGLKDVFKSIKYGWADKGMKSWKDDFSPNQIAQLASYVKSLKGTHPAAPKDKQGELYIEGGGAKDSTKVVASK